MMKAVFSQLVGHLFPTPFGVNVAGLWNEPRGVDPGGHYSGRLNAIWEDIGELKCRFGLLGSLFLRNEATIFLELAKSG